MRNLGVQDQNDPKPKKGHFSPAEISEKIPLFLNF